MIDIPYKDRCCIRHLWGKCEEDVENGGCRFGPHTHIVPEVLLTHSYYVSMLAEHGTPTAKPAKGKGRGKGKNKGKAKDAAPAVIGEAAAEK